MDQNNSQNPPAPTWPPAQNTQPTMPTDQSATANPPSTFQSPPGLGPTPSELPSSMTHAMPDPMASPGSSPAPMMPNQTPAMETNSIASPQSAYAGVGAEASTLSQAQAAAATNPFSSADQSTGASSTSYPTPASPTPPWATPPAVGSNPDSPSILNPAGEQSASSPSPWPQDLNSNPNTVPSPMDNPWSAPLANTVTPGPSPMDMNSMTPNQASPFPTPPSSVMGMPGPESNLPSAPMPWGAPPNPGVGNPMSETAANPLGGMSLASEGTPSPQNANSVGVPLTGAIDSAPTDLSQLTGTNDQPPPPEIYNPPVSSNENLVVPSAQGVPQPTETVHASKSFGLSKIIIIIGVIMLLAIAGASAYFILGVGKTTPPPTSIPAQQAPATTPAPTATPNTVDSGLPIASSSAEASGSGSFGSLTSKTASSSATPNSSAIQLLKSRQKSPSPTPKATATPKASTTP